MKKVLAVVLSIVMLVGVFTVAASAENGENNQITGVYKEYPKTRTITFSTVSEGMDNEEPVDGDVRYVPASWYTDEDRICGDFTVRVPETDEYGDPVYEMDEYGDYVYDMYGEPIMRYINVPTDVVTYSARVYGDHVLTVVFEKQQFNAEAGEWQTVLEGEGDEAVAVTDEKSVEYYIAPNETEERELVLPKNIVTWIYTLLMLAVEKIMSFIK